MAGTCEHGGRLHRLDLRETDTPQSAALECALEKLRDGVMSYLLTAVKGRSHSGVPFSKVFPKLISNTSPR